MGFRYLLSQFVSSSVVYTLVSRHNSWDLNPEFDTYCYTLRNGVAAISYIQQWMSDVNMWKCLTSLKARFSLFPFQIEVNICSLSRHAVLRVPPVHVLNKRPFSLPRLLSFLWFCKAIAYQFEWSCPSSTKQDFSFKTVWYLAWDLKGFFSSSITVITISVCHRACVCIQCFW